MTTYSVNTCKSSKHEFRDASKRNKETNKRANEQAGDGAQSQKHTLQILLLGSNHMQSPKKCPYNAESGQRGGQECCELHPTANKQKITSLVKPQGTVGWKMKPWKNTFQLECSSFQVLISQVICRKNSNISKQFNIRARSRCSPQRGAGSCNTSCTGSAKYLTQALAKEPRCTLTLRSQTSSLALSGQFIDRCGKHNLFIFCFFRSFCIVRTKGTLELDRNLGSWCCLGHSRMLFFGLFTHKDLWSNWAPGGRTNFGQVGKRRSSMPCIELGKWSKLLGTGICKRRAAV